MLIASANPGGLHAPRSHHHPSQGPLRLADPDALPRRSRTRSNHGAGGRSPPHLAGGGSCPPTSSPRPSRSWARQSSSPHVNQRSGVSVRFSIGALETTGAERVPAGPATARRGDPSRGRSLGLPSGRDRTDRIRRAGGGTGADIVGRALKQRCSRSGAGGSGGMDFPSLTAAFEEGLRSRRRTR